MWPKWFQVSTRIINIHTMVHNITKLQPISRIVIEINNDNTKHVVRISWAMVLSAIYSIYYSTYIIVFKPKMSKTKAPDRENHFPWVHIVISKTIPNMRLTCRRVESAHKCSLASPEQKISNTAGDVKTVYIFILLLFLLSLLGFHIFSPHQKSQFAAEIRQ